MMNYNDIKEWIIKPGATNVIDLSYPMSADLTQPDFYPKFTVAQDGEMTNEIDPKTGYPLHGVYSRIITKMAEGQGTHIEASSHGFGVRGRNIDEYPLSRFIGPAVVIDITAKVKASPDYKVTTDDLLVWEKKYGKIPDGAVLVLKTGWGKYWGDYKAFFGIDNSGVRRYPGITVAACRWLVDNRHVSVIGSECATLDGDPREFKTARAHRDTPARDVLQCPPNDILTLEYLANVDRLPDAGALIICAPINFAGGAAGVVRCLAILPVY